MCWWRNRATVDCDRSTDWTVLHLLSSHKNLIYIRTFLDMIVKAKRAEGGAVPPNMCTRHDPQDHPGYNITEHAVYH
jgi:hypothetical protein